MRPTLSRSLAFASTLALGLATCRAEAAEGSQSILSDGGQHTRPQQLDLQLGLLWSGFGPGLGVAAWYAIPVLPDGFIPGSNDSLDVEFGAVLGLQPSIVYAGYSGLGVNLLPAAGVRWNLFLTPEWSAFASLKLAWNIYFLSGYVGGFAIPGTLGALYKIGKNLHLRLEAGFPFGLSAGLTFDL